MWLEEDHALGDCHYIQVVHPHMKETGRTKRDNGERTSLLETTWIRNTSAIERLWEPAAGVHSTLLIISILLTLRLPCIIEK